MPHLHARSSCLCGSESLKLRRGRFEVPIETDGEEIEVAATVGEAAPVAAGELLSDTIELLRLGDRKGPEEHTLEERKGGGTDADT